MRGTDQEQGALFSYISPGKRVPADHPLRPVREMVDEVLKEMSPRFARVYARVGRPSIAPERLRRALLLQIFYSIRSERLLMEQLNYHLLFRWFVGMEMDEEVLIEDQNGLLVKTRLTLAAGRRRWHERGRDNVSANAPGDPLWAFKPLSNQPIIPDITHSEDEPESVTILKPPPSTNC